MRFLPGERFSCRLTLTLGLLALAGCTTAGLKDWHWLAYRPSPLVEEYVLPPEGDPRYSQPMRYPPSVMKPAIRKQTDENQDGMPNGVGMPRGGMPGGGAGNFMR